MHSFADIYELAVSRQGGEQALEKKIRKPSTKRALGKIPDDRWLSGMSKSVFRAGFVWRVVENKWPDFERVFSQFDLHHCAYLNDESIEALLNDKSIIRHLKKLQSIRGNAAFLLERAEQHGSAGAYFGSFASEDYIDLLADLKRNAVRMGGTSAQYFLREMGVDSFILSRDVISALKRANIVEKDPTSKRDLANVQQAFNYWRDESGRSLTAISRILAMSID